MKIIIDRLNTFWHSFLESEGFPFFELKHDSSGGTFSDSPRIFIMSAPSLTSAFIEFCNNLLERGNVIISDHDFLKKITNRTAINMDVEMTPYHTKDFSLLLPGDKSYEQGATISTCKLRNGLLIGLQGGLDKYWSCSTKALKSISVDPNGELLAFEKMCEIVKRNVRRYAKSALLKASGFLNQPLIYLWRYPGIARSVCNLRIDVDPEKNTDKSVAFEKIRTTFQLAENNENVISFFVNFYRWLNKSSFFKSQIDRSIDLQSHNYFHCLYPDYNLNSKNFAKAHECLQTLGAKPKGFVVPEYFWYDHTAELLEQFEYSYSHSFGFDYNNYPYRPLINGKIRSYFEIPNDPLVYSKLKAACGVVNSSIITAKYKQIMNAAIASCEPCLKYEHPAILGLYPEIGKDILKFFDGMNADDVQKITLTDWAGWLKRRRLLLENLHFECLTRNGRELIEVNTDKTTELNEFGVALQYDGSKIMLKRLRNVQRQLFSVEETVTRSIHQDTNLSGETIFNPKEKRIDIWHSTPHLKKLIFNYRLYWKHGIVVPEQRGTAHDCTKKEIND